MAEWLLHVIARALAHEEARYRAGPAYAARREAPQAVLRSFRYGFADRLSTRLDELADARAAAAAERRAAEGQGSRSTALVVAKERKLDEAFRGLGVRLRTTYSSATVRDRGAFRRGAEAGGRVGLERSVGAGAGTRGIAGRGR
jgi:hypothetical protein